MEVTGVAFGMKKCMQFQQKPLFVVRTFIGKSIFYSTHQTIGAFHFWRTQSPFYLESVFHRTWAKISLTVVGMLGRFTLTLSIEFCH